MKNLKSSNHKCIFVALKARNNKYRKTSFIQIWAALLLVLFSSVFLFESLHHHDQDCTNTEKVQASSQLKIAKIKCSFCELIKHQSHHYIVPENDFISVNTDVPQSGLSFYSIKYPLAYILAATNKGPPSI
ncbi:hypothetical protein [Pedobacter rhizosphaerae]|uniref:DUF2946 domain-containing protein n=1 Tax=Pedobacter rhizosphaerae TaxID=390241 RepID=A0A1H9K3G5_9SPHI|nr:hypothetical protein [Pedobacter rhizosphaerae]SEQ93385.1 hypothetical protein SAMN04488023_102191 [Pedobacter rhizosphaerae]